MSTVTDPTSGSSAQIIAALNKKSTTTSDTSGTKTAGTPTLGQDAFLKLLITQMKNQSPLNPQENTAFVAQLAQFSSLEGITKLNTTVTSLSDGLQSSQALQASALVGRTVEVKTDKAYLAKDSLVRGTIALENSTPKLQLNIYDSAGKKILTKDLGEQAAGDLPFAWDGTLADGTKAAAGTYKFEVLAAGSGDPKAVTTYLGNNVNSVTVGANQTTTLNVDVVGPVALSAVKNIL